MPNDSASRFHNTLFVLFLSAILAYGGSFAFYLLTKFDLLDLIRYGNCDDAYYYFNIARNLAEGHFSTFDGGISQTNGYHPLWMVLITPFYWIFTREAALFGIKAFEIMLVTGAVGLVVSAVRMARLPWILLFAALPGLLSRPDLIAGMEAAAALFLLGILFVVLSLFARNPTRWKWPMSFTVFMLPWVRLEYVAISLAATGALGFVEWVQRDRRPWGPASRRTVVRSISSLKSIHPFASAWAGLLVYFAYNSGVFGGTVPVSGAAKAMWSRQLWEGKGSEYSFLENFQDMMQRLTVGPSEFVMGIEVCAYFLVAGWWAHRVRRREDALLLSFLAGVFSLGCGHLAQFLYAVLFLHPDVHYYSGWYYVPAYLLTALIVPVRCYVIGHFIRRLIFPKWPRVANVARGGVLVIGMIVTFEKVTFTGPYLSIDQQSKSDDRSWGMSSYAGTRVMNRIVPKGSVIGSWDAGIIGYFSSFPVVELNGLVNSYEYLSSPGLDSLPSSDFSRRFGITHFANGFPVELSFSPSGKALFEGIPFTLGRNYEFKLRLATPPWASSTLDPVAWFWERMEPHFAYQSPSGDVGVVIDGRLVLSFAKECAPDERPGRMLIVQWITEAGATGAAIQQPWRNEGEIPWVCGDAALLPKRTTLPVRIAVMTEETPGRPFGDFTAGFTNWRLDGDAVTIYGHHERIVKQSPISGNVSQGFLTSYHPNRGDAVTGTARSPEFTIADDQLLTFLIAGGGGDGVGIRLLADGAEVAVWRGKNTERFERVAYWPTGLAGKRLHLELFDSALGGWGHIMLDHVRLVEAVYVTTAQ